MTALAQREASQTRGDEHSRRRLRNVRDAEAQEGLLEGRDTSDTHERGVARGVSVAAALEAAIGNLDDRLVPLPDVSALVESPEGARRPGVAPHVGEVADDVPAIGMIRRRSGCGANR